MQQETFSLKTKIFHLNFAFDEIAYNYPDLAESWLESREKSSYQENNQTKQYIQAQIILKYRPNREEPTGYKIIKHQRLLMVLVKLSKKLPLFQSVEVALKMQGDLGKNKKTSNKQVQFDENYEGKSFYLKKGQNMLERMVKKHDNLIGVLKLVPQQNSKLSVREFLELSLQFIKDRFSKNNQPEQQGYCGFDIKAQIIRVVNRLGLKLWTALTKIFTGLIKQAQQDQMIGNFLGGRHKFFKIDSLDFDSYNNLRCPSIEDRWNQFFAEAGSILFEYSFGSTGVKNLNENRELNVQDLQLEIGWVLDDIQKTVCSVQTIFNYAVGRLKVNDSKILTNSSAAQQRVEQMAQFFSNLFKRHLLFTYYSQLSQVISPEDWAEIELETAMGNTQISMYIRKRQGKISPYQQNQLLFFDEENLSFPLISQSIEKQQQKTISQYSLQKQRQVSTEQFNLNMVQSRQFLSQFYCRQIATIYTFIECQKRWFFRNQNLQNTNLQNQYNTLLKWIPLSKTQVSQHLQQQFSFNYNTFSAYLGPLVYSLLQIKKTTKLRKLGKFSKNKSIIEQQPTLSQNISMPPNYFLYNDMDNILAYENMAFQNIIQCHYYLKHIRNDTRAEFDDRSWTEYCNHEVIRLVLKDKIHKQKYISYTEKTFSNKGATSSNQGANLIRIPIRGRYCQHLDFFDLSEVYAQIFPVPYCSAEEISCPKCFVDIPFDQIIYLKQVQILLELIKVFYLEEQSLKRFLIEQDDKLRIRKGKGPIKSKVLQSEDQFVLQDLRLILNHPSKSAKLKGKYLIKNMQNNNTASNHDLDLDTQPSKQNYFEFEQTMDKEIYDTLLNPNKRFKSNKKFKNLLNNFGRTTYTPHNFCSSPQDLTTATSSILNFQDKIQTAKLSVQNRWKLYKDLQKGTISI